MDCSNNYLDPNTHLNSMLRVSGNLIGLPIISVEGHTDNAISCGNAHLKFMDLLMLSIGVDDCGKPAIRVKYISTCDTNADCANNSIEDNLAKMFAYDSTLNTYAIVLNNYTV